MNTSRALSKSWDNFQIGVVFYQLLFGLHPYVVTPKYIKDDSSSEITDNIAKNLFPFGPNRNAIESFPPLHNKFSILPSEIQTLFKRAFSSNTNERPNADDWGKTIHSEIVKVGTLSPPPPVKLHRVRFLAPDGSMLIETWCNHGQHLFKHQIPHLPTFNGKVCSSWDGNPNNDIINADKDYRAIASQPPSYPSPTRNNTPSSNSVTSTSSNSNEGVEWGKILLSIGVVALVIGLSAASIGIGTPLLAYGGYRALKEIWDWN